VVLTGLADEALGLSALSAGAQDYLVKGNADGRNLLRAIRYAVGRHQLLAREQTARELAEAASRAKDQFLALISHELRTPLTPVTLLLSALRQMSSLPHDVLEDLATIYEHVELEIRLINDLLDFSSLQAGKLSLQLHPVDVHDLIREVVHADEAMVKAKNLNVALRLDAANARINADPARLKQVLGHVLGNAIKFVAPLGHIVIDTQLAADDHLRIGITDDGVGFDPAFMPRIFGIFEQSEQKLTRRFGGLGLGLTISRRLIELHGGKIDAFSQGANRGATFTIDLPRTGAPAD
jgi:signal transduction histidine kinase